MINRIAKFKLPVIGILLLTVILLTGCGSATQKTRKPAGDFSRGLLLSDEAVGSPLAAVNPEGTLVQVVIPIQHGDAGNAIQYIRLDQDARIVLDKELDLDLAPYVRAPKLVQIGEELHLVWAARESTLEGWALWHAIINKDGEVSSPPKLVSQGTDRVSQFNVTADDEGTLTIIWEDGAANSLHITSISKQGSTISPPQLLIEEGELPALIADQGRIHIAWMQGPLLFYSELVEDTTFPLEGDAIASIKIPLGNRMDGPVIGVTDSHIFMFWSILRQVGLEAGTAITEYLVFPKGDPDQARRGMLPIFPESDDFLQPYQGDLSLSEVVPAPPRDYMTTDNILDPRALSAPTQDIMLVAVSASQSIRLDTYMQIMVGIFEEGTYQSYIIGTRTTEISQNPCISLDEGGNLHLIWQEGFSGNRIFYATTALAARTRLDRVVLGDMTTLIFSGGLEAITGILLFPFAFPWMAVGLVIMIVLRLARNDEDVTQPLSILLVVVALLSYQVSKLLFMPDILVYIPFSAWLDIRVGVGEVLRIVVPIIIIALGILAAEWRRRRAESPISSLGYYMTAVLVDTVLTLSIYGVIFLGEY